MLSRWHVIGVFGVILCGLIAIIALSNRTGQSNDPFDGLIISRDGALDGMRRTAQQYGLVGAPTYEKMVVMSVGQFMTMVDRNDTPELLAGQGLTRDSQLIVYEVRGDVPVLAGFGSAGGRTDVTAFLFAIDGTTGREFESMAASDADTLPDLTRIPIDEGWGDFVPPEPNVPRYTPDS